MAQTQLTLFDLPTTPNEIGVQLPVSDLRKIDFSALDFDTCVRSVIEYAAINYPQLMNDFVANNGIVMLIELFSYVASVIALRGDMLSNEAFLPTARTEEAIINHLALIGQKPKRATPATVEVQCTVESSIGSDIIIPAGQKFSIDVDANTSIFYEIFKAPGDFTSDIVIPASKKGIVAFGIEGSTVTASFTSDGSINQVLAISNFNNVLEYPVTVTVNAGSIDDVWSETKSIGTEDLTKSYEVRFFNSYFQIIFGDGINGQIPPTDATIKVSYRIGGGVKGRIGTGQINEQRVFTPAFPYTASVPVTFINLTPSSGGIDAESLSDAAARAPRDFATHGSAVTGSDYVQLTTSYSHPAFGAIAKAVATVNTSINANLVVIYALSHGASGLIGPNEGLKRAVTAYLSDLNVITDQVIILDGQVKNVDIDVNIIVSKDSDASIVKNSVDAAVASYFNLSNWKMGEGLYVSDLFSIISKVDGVKFVDVVAPRDNILPSNQVNTSNTPSAPNVIALNEVISLRNQNLKYYYDNSSNKINGTPFIT